MWTSPTPYGDLVITINLSKPEKDPRAIAAAILAFAAVFATRIVFYNLHMTVGF